MNLKFLKIKFLWVLVLLLIVHTGVAQVSFDKTHYDFGKLHGDEERFVDFYLKNNGTKDVYILSVRNPMEITFLRETDKIAPNQSVVVRFQINKRSVGKFNYEIPVFTSDKNTATNVKLVGSIESLPQQNNFTACPNFNQKPADGNPLEFSLTVETIDELTGEKLENSTVAIIQNGFGIGKWKLKNGKIKLRIPLGFTYFYATHSDYYPSEKNSYVNIKNNHVIIPLTRKIKDELKIEDEIAEQVEEKISPQENQQEVIVELIDEERIITIDLQIPPEVDIEDLIEAKEEKVEEKTDIENIPPKLKELEKDNFDEQYFDPINITFIIDVSSSMNQYGRFDLMKYSLAQLIGMLRPQDKLGIVAYASNAFVIMNSTTGDNKNYIKEEVKKLKASGHTDGTAGIKLGFKQAWKNRIDSGKSHVIIITDGAFNNNSGDYKKIIEKNYNSKDITLSVIGIKSNEKAEANMREAAELGGGRFILIEDLSDAQNKLNQEIRLAAFKF